MAVAYLARQLSLGRLVVIKFLSPDANLDPIEQAGRFRREAELMACLSHPNITTIFDFGIEEGQPFLVMEYVEGGDLRKHMDGGKPMAVGRVRHLVGALVGALECLHQNGILHRDLKPENILMAGGQTPKVSDFGIAVPEAALGSLTHSGHFAGTIGYMAPEVQYRLPVDERADQYSLAAVAYELLTGHLPLGAFPLPSSVDRRLDPAVDEVFQRALCEDRGGRFATVREFGDALDRALAAPRKRRHRVWIFAGAGAVGVCSVLAVATSKRNPSLAGTRKPESAPTAVRAEPLGGGTRTVLPGAAPRAAATLPANLTNSVGMVLMLIPKGTSVMGSPDSDPHARPDEKPRHTIAIQNAYYMGACEVTVGQFRVFIAESHYRTKPERDSRGGAMYDREQRKTVFRRDLSWRNHGFGRAPADDEPVVQVCREDAVAFCEWLSRREGVSYRLPTEAEWEYACRAGSDAPWCFGNDQEALGDYAWFKVNAEYTVHPVRMKLPNAFGLFDMYGNVWEWCSDRYLPGYERPDPSAKSELSNRPEYVIRGGSFGSKDLAELRSASRHNVVQGYRYFSCGFRVRRALSPQDPGVGSP
jgi:serine/threonine-protein kinase